MEEANKRINVFAIFKRSTSMKNKIINDEEYKLFDIARDEYEAKRKVYEEINRLDECSFHINDPFRYSRNIINNDDGSIEIEYNLLDHDPEEDSYNDIEWRFMIKPMTMV